MYVCMYVWYTLCIVDENQRNGPKQIVRKFLYKEEQEEERGRGGGGGGKRERGKQDEEKELSEVFLYLPGVWNNYLPGVWNNVSKLKSLS